MSNTLPPGLPEWKKIPLSDVFSINTSPEFPARLPGAVFQHWSLPAWDATGGPAMEFGASIESNKTSITGPAVLVSKLNPRKPRVAVVHSPGPRTCCSTEFICYSPKRVHDDLRFWGAYFSAAEFSGRLARAAIGSTNSHTRASPPATLRWLVPDVPEREQRMIGDLLQSLETAIRETEAIIAKLNAVKQGLLHDLLTRGIDANGELRPPQAEAPHLYKRSPLGWIPKEWNVVAIEELADSYAGGTPSRDVPAFFGGKIPWVKSTEVNKESIHATDESLSELGLRNSSAKWVPAETPLIAMYGATAGVVSWLCIKATTNQAVLALVPKRDSLGRWIYWALKLSAPRLLLSIQGSGQPNLSKCVIDAHAVAVPPLHEQKVIVDVLDSHVNRTNSEQLSLNKLREEKHGLMDDLLTGRVRVTSLLSAAQQEPTRSA